MDIFYDWEFIDDGKTIDPVSLGMVRENGTEIYAVNIQLDEKKLFENQWMIDNVWPSLPRVSCNEKHPGMRGICHTKGAGHLDRDHPAVRPLRQIARMVKDLVLSTPDPDLWAYYSAYDHVLLAQLFGPMRNLPEGFPMYTQDLQQEVRRLDKKGLDATSVKKSLHNPDEHNPLEDAKWNMRLRRELLRLEEGA